MKVHYLCRPPDRLNDFVYAAELPSHYYAPGMFCVEAFDTKGNLGKSFDFPAIFGEQLITLSLIQVTARTYVVDVEKLGMKFFFKLVSLDRTARYVGREPTRFSDFPLFRAQPASSQRLENACIEHNFYFVGFGSDEQNRQNQG